MTEENRRPVHYPLHRPVAADSLPGRGSDLRIVASPEECRALAADLGIVAVRSLVAELHLAPWRSAGLRVTGRLRGEVTQTCVVTLDPVDQVVDEDIDLRFLPAAMIEKPGEEIEIDALDEDPPEPLPEGQLDLGQIVGEHLALGLDPYPRAPGAAFAEAAPEPDAEPERPSPFAALKALKGETEGD